jgi:TonB family protein
LPELPSVTKNLDLPISVPAFSVSEVTPGPFRDTLWPNAGEPDEAAQLESAFDLERFFPRIAKIRGISGKTHVRLTIGADGKVLTGTIYGSEPAGVFESATHELIRSLLYRPAKKNGTPVMSVKEITIDWTFK